MNNKTPLFSVIIPTFNRRKELERCLESLVLQTFKNFEVLICDDGSTDSTFDLIKTFKRKLNIQYLWNENWGGPAHPRNIGINASKGKWICFLDSDDWWYPKKLETCLSFLEEYDIIYHDLHVFSNKGRSLLGHRKSRKISKAPFEDLVLNGNILSNSTVVVRKSIVDKVGCISEDKKLIAVEDYDFLIRISLVTDKFGYISKFLGAYFWDENSSNISFSNSQVEKNRYLLDKYLNLLSDKNSIEAEIRFTYRKARLYQVLNQKTMAIENYKISLQSKNKTIVLKSLVFLNYLRIILIFKN